MRKSRKNRVRVFSIFATILMVMSLLTPGFAGAVSKEDLHTSLNNSKKVAEAKISKDLFNQLSKSKDEKVTFLVKFTEKADPMKVAEKAKESAKNENLSAYNQEIIQRSAVISELKAVAMESQHNVQKFLDAEIEKGNAKDVHAYYIVNGMAVTATKEVMEKIASFPEVEKILPNEKRQLMRDLAVDESTTIQRDIPSNKSQDVTKKEKTQVVGKGMEQTENQLQSIEWNIDRINAPDVWSMGFDGSGTVVANIDTGVQWDHPALKEKYAGYDAETGEVDHTYSFFDPVNGQTVPYDDDGHGTHTMGTMVGSEPDGSNQIGVAPGAKWIAVQAFTPSGAYDTDLIAAAEWIMAPGDDVTKAPDVVNNSWGGGPGIDEWYRDTVIAWRAAGIFPAFAAGNTTLSNPGGPGSVATPANYPESFAVGNTMIDDSISNSSLRGPSPYGEIKPDVSAPGTGIRSSVPVDSYASYNGTSMAAPHVAGTVALLRQVNGNLDVDQLEQILMDTARERTDDEYPDYPNNGYGYGIIDAFAAVSSIADGLGTIEGVVTMDGEDTEAPVYEHTPPNGMLIGKDLQLSIFASDNVSVTSVEINYNGNTVEANLVEGDFRSGQYQVIIPAEEITGESFTYNWVINDFGGNEVITDDYIIELTEPLFFENFATDPDWGTFQGGTGAVSWEWGEPTSGPGSAQTGENVYATNLSGNYNASEYSWLDMPAIELPEGDAAVEIEHWYDIESSWDYGYLVATNDPDGQYQVLDSFTGNSSGWVTGAYDLSEFSGDEVYIAFVMESDSIIHYPGWYIDNVTVVDVAIPGAQTNDLTATVTESSGIPLDATVSVLETNRSTATNPADGSYSLLHEAGTFTLVAEAYGFASVEQSVDLEADGIAQANFTLEELPKATVSGSVTSEKTGNPIEGATLLLVEDANVEPVQTDADGNYDLTAYEGTYTVRVVANDYHSKEVELELNGDMNLNIELEPFFTVPGGEIAYDDGTAENARAFYDPGNKWAVKMSLPEGRDAAIVTDGVFQFHGTDWPVPGDTPFAVEVWSAGADGMPDEMLAGPIEAEAVRDLNEWTVVDLSEHNIMVDGDFFMVYHQTGANPNVPGLATDEDGPNAGRSYQSVGGVWSESPTSEGNYMIRARVAYAADDPVITSPDTGLVTNETNITVEGTASPTTSVNLMNNGEVVGTADIGDDGEFAFDVALSEGQNDLQAFTYINGEEATESDILTITRDTAAPDIAITSPENGDQTNGETVTVEGTVTDDHLESVEVNGQATDVAEDGSYSKRILLDEGDNVIEVVATDEAGNISTETITIEADWTAPEISNVTPDEDHHLQAGESVMITFDSEPGLSATFAVHMPLMNLNGVAVANVVELPFLEMSPGHYVATWTATSNVVADGAMIEIKATDEFGNESRELAEGKLFINLDE